MHRSSNVSWHQGKGGSFSVKLLIEQLGIDMGWLKLQDYVVVQVLLDQSLA